MAGRHETHIKKTRLTLFVPVSNPSIRYIFRYSGIFSTRIDMVHGDESKGTIIGAAIV